ncbi:lipopolysaccharide biosynthesis protein [Skermania piniformis]|uniref:lipopolysaccharide biosynthesis protein n=1 Tax=Skermania pinensis TaxID=39122 RepID=UPI0012EDE8FE|nr:oligosaccharide flippase family protein [Skermania piniformis]
MADRPADARTTGESGGELSSGERRAVLYGTLIRIAGTPVVAVAGLANTAVVVSHTGPAIFGVVTLIATVGLLFPFADLGIGAAVTTVSARPGPLAADPVARATIRRALGVLGVVGAAVAGLALTLGVADGWHQVIGLTTSPADRWAITVALCLFAATIPAGLGTRILIGIDRNQLAVAILMLNSIAGLTATLALAAAGVSGIWFAVAGPAGALAGNLVATVVALRLTGLRPAVLRAPAPVPAGSRLLAGSAWMFLIGIGLPLGLQSHRLLLAHLSTPDELSRYALMAQIYALTWSVFATAGMAFWPVFVKRRNDTGATVTLWRRAVLGFAGAAVPAAVLLAAGGPPAADLLGRGQITVSAGLATAFGLLLLTQCIHLPSGMLLTAPAELRWQAWCVLAMGLLGVVGGGLAADRFGATGVVLAAAGAVLLAQVLPDLLGVPRLIDRRADRSEPPGEGPELGVAGGRVEPRPTQRGRTRDGVLRQRRFRAQPPHPGHQRLR